MPPPATFKVTSPATPAKKWGTVQPQYLATSTRTVKQSSPASLPKVDPTYAPKLRPLGCAISKAGKDRLEERMGALHRACAAIDDLSCKDAAAGLLQQAQSVAVKARSKPLPKVVPEAFRNDDEWHAPASPRVVPATVAGEAHLASEDIPCASARSSASTAAFSQLDSYRSASSVEDAHRKTQPEGSRTIPDATTDLGDEGDEVDEHEDLFDVYFSDVPSAPVEDESAPAGSSAETDDRGALIDQLESAITSRVTAKKEQVESPSNILKALDDVLAQTAPASKCPGTLAEAQKSEAELEQLHEQLEMTMVQNQALYCHLEVLAATEARGWATEDAQKLKEDIENLKMQQMQLEEQIKQVEDELDDARLREMQLVTLGGGTDELDEEQLREQQRMVRYNSRLCIHTSQCTYTQSDTRIRTPTRTDIHNTAHDIHTHTHRHTHTHPQVTWFAVMLSSKKNRRRCNS